MPRSGGLGGGVRGGVAYGVPKQGLGVGDGVRFDVGFDHEHFGNESAVRVVIEEALEAAVTEGGGIGRGAARGVGGADEAGVVGEDGAGLTEQLSNAAHGGPFGDA